MKKLLTISLLFFISSLFAQGDGFFTTTSTWYTEIPDTVTVMPNSANYVADLKFNESIIELSLAGWSVPIWWANDTTSIKYVDTPSSTIPDEQGWDSVPIPWDAVPASEYDEHMVVINADTTYAWDFYHAVGSQATWQATVLRRWDLSTTGINSPYDLLGKARYSPVPLLHGLVTYNEVAVDSSIDHALIFGYYGAKMPDPGTYPCEAYNAGVSSRTYAMSGGYRLQLSPTFDVDDPTWGLNWAGKIIATALKTYGMIFVENMGVGSNGIYLEDLEDKSETWTGRLTAASINGIPIDSFRVVIPVYPTGGGPYTISTSVLGSGTITLVPDEATYDAGDSIKVTATPSTNWEFISWQNGLSGTQNPDTFIVATNNDTITALFAKTLTTPSSGGYPRTMFMQFGTVPSYYWLAQPNAAGQHLSMVRGTSTAIPYGIHLYNSDTKAGNIDDWQRGFTTWENSSTYEALNYDNSDVDIYAGGATLKDFTDYCLTQNGLTYSEAALAKVKSISIDWNDTDNWDFIATDGLWKVGSLRGDNNAYLTIDLDRNSTADWSQYGSGQAAIDFIGGTWNNAVDDLTTDVVTYLQTYNSGFIGNTGRMHYDGETVSRGGYSYSINTDYIENWIAENAEGMSSRSLTRYATWMTNQPDPELFIIDAKLDYDTDFRTLDYLFGFALMGSAWFGATDQGTHHYYWWYDMYEIPLGDPTSSMQKIITLGADDYGIWVRFFENGVVILNHSQGNYTVYNSNISGLTNYDGPYVRPLCPMEVDKYNGNDFSSISLLGGTENGLTSGDAIILIKSTIDADTVMCDRIIDIDRYSTTVTKSPATLVGSWTMVDEDDNDGSSARVDDRQEAYYTVSKYYTNLAAYASAAGSDSAVFSPELLAASYYIYVWYPGIQSQTECTDATYRVWESDGTYTDYEIDQSANQGSWVQLGTSTFDLDEDSKVVLRDGSSGILVADAVKFVYSGSSTGYVKYTLNVTTVDSGSVTLNPAGGIYDPGQEVILTAVPATNYAFSSWSGSLTGSTNPDTLTMSSNKNVTATFARSSGTQYTVTTTVYGSGSISLDPPIILNKYLDGTSVDVTATASTDWTFSSWGGDLSGSTNPETISVDSNMTIVAYFTYTGGGASENTLRMEAESMDMSSYAIESQPTWSNEFGAKITVANSWMTGTLTDTIPSGHNYDTLKVVYLDEADGLSIIDVAINDSLVDTWVLDLWIPGDLDSSLLRTRTIFLETPADSGDIITITGHRHWGEFVRIDYIELEGHAEARYILTVNTIGEGTVAVDPYQANYADGDTVELTATPATNWIFSGFTGDLISTDNPDSVKMDSNITVNVIFTEFPTPPITGLTLTTLSIDSVKAVWTDDTEGEDGYGIYLYEPTEGWYSFVGENVVSDTLLFWPPGTRVVADVAVISGTDTLLSGVPDTTILETKVPPAALVTYLSETSVKLYLNNYLFRDNFNDEDYTNDSTWTVQGGSFTVDSTYRYLATTQAVACTLSTPFSFGKDSLFGGQWDMNFKFSDSVATTGQSFKLCFESDNATLTGFSGWSVLVEPDSVFLLQDNTTAKISAVTEFDELDTLKWHDLKIKKTVSIVGSDTSIIHTVYVDNSLVGTESATNDTVFSTSYLGLITSATSNLRFDNISFRQIRPSANHDSTQYAIREALSGTYLQTDGTLGAVIEWANWHEWGGESGIAVTGLTKNTTYTIQVKSRNEW